MVDRSALVVIDTAGKSDVLNGDVGTTPDWALLPSGSEIWKLCGVVLLAVASDGGVL